MAKITLFGDENMKSPGPSSAEAAAAEYFWNRVTMGDLAPRPPIKRWSTEQRGRFEKELERLEKKNRDDKKAASDWAVSRPIGPAPNLS